MKQFEWTDELVHEYQIFQFLWYQKNATNEDIELDKHLAQKCMDAFKQSKQPKPEWEVMKVVDPNRGIINVGNGSPFNYVESDTIHSVKRLSDGEIFSVGDAIEWKITAGIFSSTIQGFELEYLDMMVRVENNSRVNLCVIQKAKQPLFTTEDGVPVYEGDKYFGLDSDFIIQEYKSGKFDDGTVDRWVFSTRAAAEEYVIKNKPQLSLSDVEQAYVGDKKSKEYISLIDNLRLIIRQKK